MELGWPYRKYELFFQDKDLAKEEEMRKNIRILIGSAVSLILLAVFLTLTRL